MYPALEMFNYWTTILGVEDATTLVDIYPVLFGSMGAFCSIASGYLCDYLGMVRFQQISIVVQVAVSVLAVVPSFYAQVVWLILWIFFLTGYVKSLLFKFKLKKITYFTLRT